MASPRCPHFRKDLLLLGRSGRNYVGGGVQDPHRGHQQPNLGARHTLEGRPLAGKARPALGKFMATLRSP